MIRVALAVGVALGALLAGGCEYEAETAFSRSDQWKRLPDIPLSPREIAVVHDTGDEILVVGGSDTPPCPPNAACEMPTKPPLADGAAFDPAKNTWRKIAPAPVPFEWAVAEQIGDTVYFSTTGYGRPGAPSAFLAYDIGADRWDELPLPYGDAEISALVGVDGQIVAQVYPDSYLEYDPAKKTWSETDEDPFDHGAVYTIDGKEAELRPELSDPPAGQEDFGEGPYATGLITDDAAYYFRQSGWVFDDRTGDWIDLPSLDPNDGSIGNRFYVGHGQDLLALGGVQWYGDNEFKGKMLNEAWAWSPP